MPTNEYENCCLCPHHCGVNRTLDKKGVCGETSRLRISCAVIHKGEEPPITGNGGSGTVFISGCTLHCAFCQNYQISQNSMGRIVTEEEFIKIMLELQNKGANNINIVTGTHHIPAIISAAKKAKSCGLSIPLVWNSSGYETKESLCLLNDIIDIYLPDIKTLDASAAKKFYNAPLYPKYAAAAVKQMILHRPNNTIIRHLIIPGYLELTKEVLKWFSQNASGKAKLSLMTQYTPVYAAAKGTAIPDRFINQHEYETALSWLDTFDIDDGFYQELETATDWLPDFNKSNPFSSRLSTPVWHWKYGFVEE
ncbi:MAG: radical SAM protein [Spirochaetaceae bacterium]|jgi:putative pyruvate formate lyase activating enzyme|nr:radical SAM protein [Spirochaetaceae bacterium]